MIDPKEHNESQATDATGSVPEAQGFESEPATADQAQAPAKAPSAETVPADAEGQDAEAVGELDEMSGEAPEEDAEPQDSDEVAAGPIEEIPADEEEAELNWYILKVQVNREDSIRSAIERRVKVAGLERFFDQIIVPTEDVVEFTKSGKKRLVKRKLFPGYLLIRMAMTDDAWFLIRETPGVGDFTGSSYGTRPSPMDQAEVDRIINVGVDAETGEAQVKTAIPFKPGDRVRVKEGYFENFEGEVESIDEANGRVTVIISIFGRSTPVELEHWQVEAL